MRSAKFSGSGGDEDKGGFFFLFPELSKHFGSYDGRSFGVCTHLEIRTAPLAPDEFITKFAKIMFYIKIGAKKYVLFSF